VRQRHPARWNTFRRHIGARQSCNNQSTFLTMGAAPSLPDASGTLPLPLDDGLALTPLLLRSQTAGRTQ
jgi:hypothetical protein